MYFFGAIFIGLSFSMENLINKKELILLFIIFLSFNFFSTVNDISVDAWLNNTNFFLTYIFFFEKKGQLLNCINKMSLTQLFVKHLDIFQELLLPIIYLFG